MKQLNEVILTAYPKIRSPVLFSAFYNFGCRIDFTQTLTFETSLSRTLTRQKVFVCFYKQQYQQQHKSQREQKGKNKDSQNHLIIWELLVTLRISLPLQLYMYPMLASVRKNGRNKLFIDVSRRKYRWYMGVLNHAFYEGNRLKQEYRQTFTAIDMDDENMNLFSHADFQKRWKSYMFNFRLPFRVNRRYISSST